jgi:hypothetical protein
MAYAEENPGDAVKIVLAGNETINGSVLRSDRDAVLIDTKAGKRLVERKSILKIETLPAEIQIAVREKDANPPAGKQVAAPGLDKNNAGEVDDLPDVPAEKLKPNAANKDLLNKLNAPAAMPAFVPPPQAETGLVSKINAEKSMSFEDVRIFIEARLYEHAVYVLRNIVTKGTQDDVSKANELSQKHFKKPLSELMVMCYLTKKCRPCNGEGVMKCEQCLGIGSMAVIMTRQKGQFLDPGTRIEQPNASAGLGSADPPMIYRKWQLCELCRGNGHERCSTCHATRLRFTQPTPYERDAYVTTLIKRGDKVLYNNEGSYADTTRETPPNYEVREEAKLKPMLQQVWLRDSIGKVKSDILRLWRAEAYYNYAMKADPTYVLRNERDIEDEITKIGLRRFNLYAELHERNMVYATNRTEHRLDEAEYAEENQNKTKKIISGE